MAQFMSSFCLGGFVETQKAYPGEQRVILLDHHEEQGTMQQGSQGLVNKLELLYDFLWMPCFLFLPHLRISFTSFKVQIECILLMLVLNQLLYSS